MTDARTLLLDLLTVIPDGAKAAAMFAEHGVLELPILHTVGMPKGYQSRQAIQEFYGFADTALYRISVSSQRTLSC